MTSPPGVKPLPRGRRMQRSVLKVANPYAFESSSSSTASTESSSITGGGFGNGNISSGASVRSFHTASSSSTTTTTTTAAQKVISVRTNKKDDDDDDSATAADSTVALYLLDRLGGEAVLDLFLDEFYKRLVADPKLSRFFDRVNIEKLKLHQRGFLKTAFTEIPETINVPRLLLRKHARMFKMGLNEHHFDIVAMHMQETMKDLQVKQPLIDEALEIVGPLRELFVEGAKNAVAAATSAPSRGLPSKARASVLKATPTTTTTTANKVAPSPSSNAAGSLLTGPSDLSFDANFGAFPEAGEFSSETFPALEDNFGEQMEPLKVNPSPKLERKISKRPSKGLGLRSSSSRSLDKSISGESAISEDASIDTMSTSTDDFGVNIITANNFAVPNKDTERETQAALLRTLRFAGIKFLRITVVDAFNSIRCRSIPLEQCSPDTTLQLPEVCLAGLPSYGDVLVYNTGFDASGVVEVRPDFGSLTVLPFSSTAVVFGTCHKPMNRGLSAVCTRGLLKRVLRTAQEEHGVSFNVGMEIEFYLVDPKTGEAVDGSVFGNSTTMDRHHTFVSEVVDTLKKMEIPIGQINAESGPGQMVIALKERSDVIGLVDNSVLIRMVVEYVAGNNGLQVLFLPKFKPDAPGNGLHLHMNFERKQSSESALETFKKEGPSFVQGVLNHLTGLMAVTMPTTNSFRRLGPGCWTGAALGWDVEDQEAPLRLCRDFRTGFVTKVEVKLSDSTANLYLSLACLLSCGLRGVVNKNPIQPPLSKQKGKTDPMPDTPVQALTALHRDRFLSKIVMGEELSRGYILVRKSEADKGAKLTLQDEVRDALRK